MLTNANDAKAKLESEGLYVSLSDHSLWIAAAVRDAGVGGIKISDDACSLIGQSGRWVAVFPAEGLFAYEVPGSLAELVPLVISVYAHYRRTGGPFRQAFAQVVGEPESYLAGRAPARV